MSTLAELDFEAFDMQRIIPGRSSSHHKGQMGRIAVIGGSLEYTGAPYFAAMSSLRIGADLAHVFCSEAAGTSIKAYSPDLIVHPILDREGALTEIVDTWLPRMHAVVIGPGLGRSPKIISLVENIMRKLKEIEKLTIVDADGLHILTQDPKLLVDVKNIIITPNIVEYDRLVKSVENNLPKILGPHASEVSSEDEAFLTQCFPHLMVVRKGERDMIFDSESKCIARGGGKTRCGGQGDVLAGAIAVFSYWSQLVGSKQGIMLGAYTGCCFTRLVHEKTNEQRGRSMVTGDFIENIGPTFREHFPE